MNGTFYGVGLGPGDPDLMTVKAARLIGRAKIVAYPSLPGVASFARSIAAGVIPEGCTELPIEIPMTTKREPAQAAYDIGADRIGEALLAGHDVVYLCEGDPLFYGSFMYLHGRLEKRFSTQVVPGVTSISAASARTQRALAARNDVLSVIPGTLDDQSIRKRMDAADSFVILKVGRNLGRLRALITEMGFGNHAVYAARVSLTEENILPLHEAPDPAPYFSMILVVKGADPWL